MPSSSNLYVTKRVLACELMHVFAQQTQAAARGSAPLPPGKGGAAPAPRPPSEPAKVVKYRAVKDLSGPVNFKKGATVFVVGKAKADGSYQVVYSGQSGFAPVSHLVEITDALLERAWFYHE